MNQQHYKNVADSHNQFSIRRINIMKNITSNPLASIIKSFTCGALIGSLCFCSLISASAASSAKGAMRYVTINGVSFNMQNSLYTGIEGSDSHKYARACTYVGASQNLNAGNLGTKPMLYNDNGSIAVNGTWTYSTNNISGLSSSVSKTYFSGSPSFYSYGYVNIWDGYNYITYRPYKTPSLNDYT